MSGSRSAVSLSCERTLTADVTARTEIEGHVRDAAETVARRLRGRGVRVSGVRLKLKRSDFRVITRQCLLREPTDVAADLFRAGRTLLSELDDTGPFRLVGLGVYEFAAGEREGQLDFADAASSRARRLETTLDELAERFGAGAVQRAANLVADRGMGMAANLDFLGRAADEPGDD